MCSLGDIMNAALPASLKLASETKILLHQAYNHDYSGLTDDEYLIAEALSLQNELSILEIQSILDKKTVFPIIKSLIDKRVIILYEELIEKFKPKTAEFIQLNPDISSTQMKSIFEDLSRAPKQLETLMQMIRLKQEGETVLEKLAFIKSYKSDNGVLKKLTEKGIILNETKIIGRLHNEGKETNNTIAELNDIQKDALKTIKTNFKTQNTVLLHGVTGSGKTEIYIHLIEEALKKDKQALYLVPEIALTAQIVNRLKNVFGNQVGIYHSKYNNNEKVEIWNDVLHNKYKVILGARSALFLPFKNLDLIIVDEEHDGSYKQHDPSPRYHARDSAIYLARLHQAKVLLGTATPSLETYTNVLEKKYGFAHIAERFGGIQLPTTIMANVKEETKQKKIKSHFTTVLLDKIKDVLALGEQVILFQNRRGYSPFLECGTCGWVPHCKNCEVSLTYHKINHELRCHYCGYKEPTVNSCKACGSNQIQIQSFGTEKIEDELSIFFPDAKIGRMDLDTVKNKKGHEKIIHAFETKQIDILVGTQMITKGLDFDNVGLVGILSADHLLNYPDFRANERAFQLMAQVSGRAGRKKQGTVIIQANDPNMEILNLVKQNDFKSFYRQEMIHRKSFSYPPYFRIIKLTIKHKKYDYVENASKLLANNLYRKLGKRVLGPSTPIISRIRTYYLREILIKLDKDKDNASKAKQAIKSTIDEMQKTYKSAIVHVDVDPY